MAFDLVLFGGTGDLAWRKLMPALFQAFRHGKLPPDGRILAVARDARSDDEYRALIHDRFADVEQAKRPSEADANRWVLSSYFTSDWMPSATARTAMPLALDMAHLYSALLQRLMPLPARPQETLPDWIARIEQTASKRREVEKTQARLAKEKQFNRNL